MPRTMIDLALITYPASSVRWSQNGVVVVPSRSIAEEEAPDRPLGRVPRLRRETLMQPVEPRRSRRRRAISSVARLSLPRSAIGYAARCEHRVALFVPRCLGQPEAASGALGLRARGASRLCLLVFLAAALGRAVQRRSTWCSAVVEEWRSIATGNAPRIRESRGTCQRTCCDALA